MATPIRVPDLGTTVDEVRLVRWLIEEGQSVRRGQPIAEMETDKAATELESVAEGVLLKQMVPEDTEVGEGSVIAYVGEPGESVPVAEAPEEEEPGREPKPSAAPEVGERPRVSPVVRNLARKLEVNLGAVEGTGRGGTITREDVMRAGKAVGEALSRRQSAVARAVARSAREIPHLRLQTSVDMTAVERMRRSGESRGWKPGYDAVFLKTMAVALSAQPRLAARMQDDRVVPPEGMHLAVAVGVGSDLFLPVIRDVDTKSLSTLTEEVSDLARRAREGELRAEELTGGGMALSNLGMYPIEAFDALIFPDHGAMLSVGAVRRRVVPFGEDISVRPMATVRLAADHRIVNGRQCAEYLSVLKEALEEGKLE